MSCSCSATIGSSGCVKRAKRRADGTISLRSAIRFDVISAAMFATPVTLASGRAMLVTNPKKTGSATIKTPSTVSLDPVGMMGTTGNLPQSHYHDYSTIY